MNVEEYAVPRKDDRMKAKRCPHSFNLRTELQVNEKKKTRFIQSMESTGPSESEQKDFEDFYGDLSKKEKRQYDKLSETIDKLESKGIEKDPKKNKDKTK